MPDDQSPRTEAQASEEGSKWNEAKIRVFLSHKMIGDTAEKFAEIIRGFSGKQIAVFTAADSLYGGREIKETVADKLDQSDLVVLLYMTEKEDWKWCLFEVGVFSGLNYSAAQKRPIVCLHPPKTTNPDPIRDKKSVTVNAPSKTVRNGTGEAQKAFVIEQNKTLISDFLKPLMNGELIPGGPKLGDYGDNALADPAYRIAELFAQTDLVPRFAEPKLVLTFNDDELPTVGDDRFKIRDEVKVRAYPTGTLRELFGIADDDDEAEWIKIKDVLIKKGDRYKDRYVEREITRSMLEAARKEVGLPVASLFRACNDSIYRPIIYRVDDLRRGDDRSFYQPKEVHILLAEQPSPDTLQGREPEQTIFNMLQLGHRLRAEVVDLGIRRLKRVGSGPKEAKTAADKLMHRFNSIVKVGQQGGLVDKRKAQKTFSYSIEAQRKIGEMFDAWDSCWARIVESAGSRIDVDELIRALIDFRVLNDRFTAFAAKEYYERVELHRRDGETKS